MLIGVLLDQVLPYLIGVAAALVAYFGWRYKIVKDAKNETKRELELEEHKNVQSIIERRNEAIASVGDSIRHEGLRKDDGYKRD